MPLEEATGCLALIGRACLAILETCWSVWDIAFFRQSWEFFRDTCQFVGRCVVLVCTLFQVWLKEEHDTLAGIIGLVSMILMVAGVLKLMERPPRDGAPAPAPHTASARP